VPDFENGLVVKAQIAQRCQCFVDPAGGCVAEIFGEYV
jgi:hypothetical protein